MYLFVILILIFSTVINLFDSGESDYLSDNTTSFFETLEDSEDTNSLSNNLKAKAYRDQYFTDAETYKEKFYEDSSDIDSYNKAIENYTKSIDVLMTDGVDTANYRYDICVATNNMASMKLVNWELDETDMQLLDEVIEGFKQAQEYNDEDQDPTVTENLGFAYYSKWRHNYDDLALQDLTLQYYEMSYELDPDSYSINNLLGLYYIDMWEQKGYDREYYELAEDYLEAAIEIDGEKDTAIDNLTYLYMKEAELENSDTNNIDIWDKF